VNNALFAPKKSLPAVEGEATQVQKEQTSHHDLTGSETILIAEADFIGSP
jgi:hypothetical protein